MLVIGAEYSCTTCGCAFTTWRATSTRRCRECLRVASRASAKRNIVKRRATAKAWRLANPDKCRQHTKERRERNPRTFSASWQRRRVWLSTGDVTFRQLQEMYIASGGRCHWCKQIIDTNPSFRPKDACGFDHVIPRSKGGLHTIGNMVVSCLRCNSTRSDLYDEPPNMRANRDAREPVKE